MPKFRLDSNTLLAKAAIAIGRAYAETNHRLVLTYQGGNFVCMRLNGIPDGLPRIMLITKQHAEMGLTSREWNQLDYELRDLNDRGLL